jgi:hypothetical protein
MQLLFRIHYRIPKKTTAVELLDVLRYVFRENGWSDEPSWFSFHDHLHMPSKPSQRIIKCFQEFYNYFLPAPHPNGVMDTGDVLTNYDQNWERYWPSHLNKVGVSPSIESIAAIFKGIPRSYPFKTARVVFDDIPWDRSSSSQCSELTERMIGSGACSCIVLDSDWWISGRKISLDAYVLMEPPAIDAGELLLPDATQKILEKLGKIRRQELFIIPTAAEQEATESHIEAAKSLIEEAKIKADRLAENGKLPFDLQRRVNIINENDSADVNDAFRKSNILVRAGDKELIVIPKQETGIPKKKIQNHILKPLGYKHQSKLGYQGFMVYEKITARNNCLKINFDFGTYSQHISAFFQMEGALWRHGINIQYWRGPQLPGIYTEQEFLQAITNIGAVLTYLEDTLVMKLEMLYGSSPSWFGYSK